MMKNVAGVNVNGVKRVNVQEMKEGYLAMALINLEIARENEILETEANTTLEVFLGN